MAGAKPNKKYPGRVVYLDHISDMQYSSCDEPHDHDQTFLRNNLNLQENYNKLAVLKIQYKLLLNRVSLHKDRPVTPNVAATKQETEEGGMM